MRKLNQKGITLIEMLIYMGLLAVLLVSITDMFVSILNIKVESEAVSAVEQDGNYLLARFYYDVGRADAITTPATPGDTSSTLVLDISGETYTYVLSGTNLQLTNNSGTSNLNGSETEVSGLNFRKIGPPTKPTTKVDFVISSVTERNSGKETKVFSTTIGLR